MICTVLDGELILTNDDEDIIWKGKPDNRNVKKAIFIHDREFIIVMFALCNEYQYYDNNIICFDINMNIIWRADLPTTEPDVYVNMVYNNSSLYANSWSCYRVKIDLNDGHILSRVFTK